MATCNRNTQICSRIHTAEYEQMSSVCVCGAFFTSSSHPKDPEPEGFVVGHLLVVSMML